MLAITDKLLAVLLLAPLAPAQFLNRAVWLGIEQEDLRRDFPQGTEYFLDRMSYVVVAPWWDRGLLRFQDEVQFRLGSVTSREFTAEGHIDHSAELGDGVRFRYHFLQGENRDTRFVRNAIGFEYATGEQTALFVQGTPLADKGDIDLSAGAWLLRTEDRALRVMLTAVDAPSEKSTTVVYERDPYGVQIAGTFGDRDHHRVAFDFGAQLPFEMRRLDTSEVLEQHRYIGSVDTHLHLAEDRWLVCSVESEYTSKQLRATVGANPEQERFRRHFHQLRSEYWQDGPTPWSVGFAYTFHSEHGRRRVNQADDLRTQRREWFAIARCQLPLDGRLSFEPQLLAGHVRDQFRDGVDDRRRSRFEGKVAWNLRWDFAPDIRLALLVTTQLDDFAFGGGGAQFIARF